MNISAANIQSLFELPEDYSFNRNAVRYYGSLTPAWDLLKEVKHVNLILEIDGQHSNQLLKHHNSVNTHLFKPKYEYSKKTHQLDCFVASTEILAHTLKGLYFADYFSTKIDFEISAESRREKAMSEYIDEWTIHDNVIICRIESFLVFLKIHLLFELGVSPEEIATFVVLTESVRISPSKQAKLNALIKNLSLKYNLDIEEYFVKHYSVTPQKTLSPYILSTNVKAFGKELTLLQLTWGYSLTYELLKSIIAINKKIKKLAVCGGVGYIGQANVSVDDVFIPTKLLTGNKKSEYRVMDITNDINEDQEMRLFSKQVTTGTMRSVQPSVNIFSNTASLKERINEIDAFDMELESIIDASASTPGIRTGYIYYIMDKPNEGLGLGATYYNARFLRKLLSTYNRGKFYCFEKIISFIQKD